MEGNGNPAMRLHSVTHVIEMYTGNGNGFDIYCSGNAIYALSYTTDAIVAYPGGNGSGLHLWGGWSTGDAFALSTYGEGSTTVPATDAVVEATVANWDTNGITLAGDQPRSVTFDYGVTINQGSTNAPGLSINGNGSGEGVLVTAGVYGTGAAVIGGSGDGYGLLVASPHNHALYLVAETTGHAINVVGGSEWGNGISVYANAGNAIDLYVSAYNTSAIYAQSWNGDAVLVYGGQNSSGLHVWGGMTSGDAVKLDTYGTGAVTIPANVPGTVKLSSDGLDNISITPTSGVPSTFPGMLVQLWRRFFAKAVRDDNAKTIKTYADDGTTVLTTQNYTDDGTVESVGGIL